MEGEVARRKSRYVLNQVYFSLQNDIGARSMQTWELSFVYYRYFLGS